MILTVNSLDLKSDVCIEIVSGLYRLLYLIVELDDWFNVSIIPW